MNRVNTYDVAIIGGGIAGLTLSVLTARAGLKTIVFEKGTYPKHKVCGEYISNESRSFLESLGLDFGALNLPEIDQFRLTDIFGNISECALNPGGFGWSRYEFDKWLYETAVNEGVKVFQNTIVKRDSSNIVNTAKGKFDTKTVITATGRTADIANRKDAWVGIKYHVENGPAENEIEIHAFENGYAGISKIEEDKYCLCYLVKAAQLKKWGSIESLETNVLARNTALSKHLASSRIMGPITTSQFYFGLKHQLDAYSIGDAAGFIPPLTGNGMSLALRSAKNVATHLIPMLKGQITQRDYEQRVEKYQQQYLKGRMKKGVMLQNLLFLKPDILNQMMMTTLSKVPFSLQLMTGMAVGKTI